MQIQREVSTYVECLIKYYRNICCHGLESAIKSNMIDSTARRVSTQWLERSLVRNASSLLFHDDFFALGQAGAVAVGTVFT